MPDMTGHELVGRLRERLQDDGSRFIALSGYGQRSDEAASRAAGFDHHVVKPVDVDRLTALISD
jgi:CheY-like chemotaxis protein